MESRYFRFGPERLWPLDPNNCSVGLLFIVIVERETKSFINDHVIGQTQISLYDRRRRLNVDKPRRTALQSGRRRKRGNIFVLLHWDRELSSKEDWVDSEELPARALPTSIANA